MVLQNIELPDYPIRKAFQEFSQILTDSKALALEAPTGSGKTTLLPLLMMYSGISEKRILMTQPRRLAAKSVAERISQLSRTPPGNTAGFRVRGESRVSESTRIEVVTEGYALAMLQADPFLSDYDWIILDEFHERHVEGDLILACLRDLRGSVDREEAPGIVLMTATWQGQPKENLGEFEFHSVEGRLFPVERKYGENRTDTPLEDRLVRGVGQALEETRGKILVFLPGRRELADGARILTKIYKEQKISLLYGGMELDAQQQVLDYVGLRRQIILSTSVAETSLTIEGVTAVVDSGLERLPLFHPASGLSKLITRKLSRSTSDQRAGRAGRLCSGIYYRLWNKLEDRELVERWEPEILNGDLASTRLQAALWGNDSLPWITPPPVGPWKRAEDLLCKLEALDNKGKITEKGRILARLPLHPRLGYMVLNAGNTEEASFLAAVLSGEGRYRFKSSKLRERLYEARHPHLRQLRRDAEEINKTIRLYNMAGASTPVSLGGMLALAYPDRIGRKTETGTYELVTGTELLCRECDFEWSVFAEITGSGHKLSGRLSEKISLDQIRELHPGLFATRRTVEYIPNSGRFRVNRTEMLDRIPVKNLPADKTSRNEKLEALQTVINKKGIEVLKPRKCTRQLLDRLNMAREAGIRDLPSGNPDILEETVEEWLLPWIGEEVNSEDVHRAMEGRLSWDQKKRLESIFPIEIEIRPGQKKKIDYSESGHPKLRGRIQEFYGLTEPVVIAEGKIALAIELLSPAMRPLQITSHLGNFWNGAYTSIRSEMRGRYPKHYWPEDPAKAEPSLATGKRRPDQNN